MYLTLLDFVSFVSDHRYRLVDFDQLSSQLAILGSTSLLWSLHPEAASEAAWAELWRDGDYIRTCFLSQVSSLHVLIDYIRIPNKLRPNLCIFSIIIYSFCDETNYPIFLYIIISNFGKYFLRAKNISNYV